MARIEKAVDANQELDLRLVGQNGLGFDLAAIANNTPYTQQPLIIQLTRAPKAFEIHPRGKELTAILKRMIERSAKNWTGFQQILEIESAQIPQGWDRQMLTIPTNTSRGPIQPTGTWDEMYNEAGAKFWNYFIETFISNPTTQKPNFAELNEVPKDWLIDMYTFDVIAYEPDPTYTKVNKAWACAGMWPSQSVEVTGERDIAAAKKIKEYAIAFPCIYDSSSKVVQTATALLNEMNINSQNPIHKPTYFESINALVKDANNGILDEALENADSWSA